MGNCAYFLRVGSTTTGYDINHDFDTIYPNKTSLGAIGSSFSLPKSGWNFLNYFRSKKNSTEVTDTDKDTDPDPVSGSQVGGEDSPFEIKYLCYYKPIRLADIGFKELDDKGFKRIREVENTANLEKLVIGINSKILSKKFEGNQISTVLIINKSGNFSNDAEILRKYNITYSGNAFDKPTVTDGSASATTTPTTKTPTTPTTPLKKANSTI